MTKEALQGFSARITQASRSELVVILYEMILSNIEEAGKALDKGDLETFQKELKQAQKFVCELMGALDFQYEISYQLFHLYIFANKNIITAVMKKSKDSLVSVKSIITKLRIGFEGVSKEDKSGPVMKNTQQLYAGLTYGKGILNETYIDPNSKSRGFIA